MMTMKLKPSLITLHDIQHRNGTSLLLQPRSPHGSWLIANYFLTLPIHYSQHISWHRYTQLYMLLNQSSAKGSDTLESFLLKVAFESNL